MILNPRAHKVLCFGDSLTWGRFKSGVRFAPSERWTYKLQEMLGQGYDVVEEGLRSRTTNIDDPDQPDRNGFPYLRACFESVDSVDVLVYLLGSNDAKTRFARSVSSIVAAIRESLEWVEAFNAREGKTTQVVLVAPPQIDIRYLKKGSSFDPVSNDKLVALAPELAKLAAEKGARFVDLSKDFKGSPNDGVHLSLEDNDRIAKLLAAAILS